jgi:hypothetical protein
MDSMQPSFHHTLENIKFYAKDFLSVISGCVCQPQSKLKINGRMCTYATTHTSQRELNGNTPVRIVKVLGEGGFSFVYLAQDEASGVSASSCDRVLPVVTADANRLGPERVCPEKDSVPNWHRGCRVSHARSRGIPEIQVRPRVLIHSYHLSTPFARHPNLIRLYVSKIRLHHQKWLMSTLCRIRQYFKTPAARAKSSTSSSPSTRPAFPASPSISTRLSDLQCSAETYKT